MRKLCAAMVALMLAVGGIFADEIKGVFVKSDGKEVTVKVDDKEKTFKIDEKAVMKKKGKDGAEKEYNVGEALAKQKEGAKLTLTVEKDKVTGFKGEGGKKKESK